MVVDTKLYDILGVKEDADASVIKRVYRDLVRKHHPDKGGDAEKFKEIDAAYKVLSNPEMRDMYDATGSVEPNSGLGNADFDILSHLFSNFPGMDIFSNNDPYQKKKTSDVLHEIHIPLEAIYNGCKKMIAIKRTTLCTDCKGQGGSNPQNCKVCRGVGMVIIQQQNGPFLMQTQKPCSDCKGTGKYHEEGKKCKICDTSGYSKTRTTVEINIPAGVPNGYVVTKKNMADEQVGFETGDLHIRIREMQHATLTRSRCDLHMKLAINLPTALVGGIIQFQHINGKQISVNLPKGKITRYGDSVCVSGKGMPKFPIENANGNSFGDLWITFNIEMPSDTWAKNANESVIRNLFSE
jgi:DnaJ family protein A protein 2